MQCFILFYSHARSAPDHDVDIRMKQSLCIMLARRKRCIFSQHATNHRLPSLFPSPLWQAWPQPWRSCCCAAKSVLGAWGWCLAWCLHHAHNRASAKHVPFESCHSSNGSDGPGAALHSAAVSSSWQGLAGVRGLRCFCGGLRWSSS